jgi:ketosteroid isomerase-like protein
MWSIFVSYRRSDAPGHAGRLYDRLSERFGEAQVFKDLDSMEPGVDFEEVVRDTIAGCDAVVAVIGKDWLAPAADGTSRLHDPDDWVRLELASALSRKGVRVVPVLVAGAQMPSSSELPKDLKPLSRRHAVELTEAGWNSQVTQLLDSLERALDGLSQKNVERLRTALEAFNRDGPEAIIPFLAPDVEWIEHRAFMGRVTYRGPHGVRKAFEELDEAFDRLRFDADEVLERDNQIVALGQLYARFRSPAVEMQYPMAIVLTAGQDGKLIRCESFRHTPEALDAALGSSKRPLPGSSH